MFGDDDDSDMAENDVFFDYDPNQLRLDLLERGVLTTKNKLSDEQLNNFDSLRFNRKRLSSLTVAQLKDIIGTD